MRGLGYSSSDRLLRKHEQSPTFDPQYCINTWQHVFLILAIPTLRRWAGGAEVQSYPWLYSKFEASLFCIVPYQKGRKERRDGGRKDGWMDEWMNGWMGKEKKKEIGEKKKEIG